MPSEFLPRILPWVSDLSNIAIMSNSRTSKLNKNNKRKMFEGLFNSFGHFDLNYGQTDAHCKMVMVDHLESLLMILSLINTRKES